MTEGFQSAHTGKEKEGAAQAEQEKEVMSEISYDDFNKVEFRAGTVVKAEEFPKARKPAYKIWVDFGPTIGVKQTSAQVTVHYSPESLVGKQVVGVVNLGTKRIAGFESQFLLVGFPDESGAVSLIRPDHQVPNGEKLF
jgi:tRNA-binding protein